MTGFRSEPRFFRRSRPEDRVHKIRIPLNDDERAIVEADAAALGLSVDDYLVMLALDSGEVKGNA